jgi:prolyl-tRNA editing enzyme YbaK/EbsC (Cys-tRNA(Pro) deacylase)
MIAARIANRKRIDTLKHGPRSANLQNESVSVTQAAKSMNVSPRTVEAAKTVLKEGGPAMIAAVVQGRIPVSKAARTGPLLPQQTLIEATVTT